MAKSDSAPQPACILRVADYVICRRGLSLLIASMETQLTLLLAVSNGNYRSHLMCAYSEENSSRKNNSKNKIAIASDKAFWSRSPVSTDKAHILIHPLVTADLHFKKHSRLHDPLATDAVLSLQLHSIGDFGFP